jgi:hypothetical protein
MKSNQTSRSVPVQRIDDADACFSSGTEFPTDHVSAVGS